MPRRRRGPRSVPSGFASFFTERFEMAERSEMTVLSARWPGLPVHQALGGRVSSACMNVPDDLRYSSDHEWVRPIGDRIRVGITDYAQDALGDIVFVDLPPVGSTVQAGGTLGEVESTKSVSEVYAPVTGRSWPSTRR